VQVCRLHESCGSSLHLDTSTLRALDNALKVVLSELHSLFARSTSAFQHAVAFVSDPEKAADASDVMLQLDRTPQFGGA
jgi:hypothetical protein